MRNYPLSNERGFGVVELMIAVVVGLLVVALTSSAFVQNKMTYLQNERFARMQEAGRTALDLLSRDLAMAGFWGDGMSNAPTASTFATLLENDCGTAVRWALLPSIPPVEYFRPGGIPLLSNTFPCIEEAGEDPYKAGTNVLAINHVSGACVSSLINSNGNYVCPDNINTTSEKERRQGNIYVSKDNSLYISADGTSPDDRRDWLLQVHIYYLAVNSNTHIPALRRKTLRKSSAGLGIYEDLGGEFVEGVEYFHIQFGIDQTNPLGLAPDGVPDCYVSLPPPASCPDVGEAVAPGEAISARIYVLVRSLEPDTFMPNETEETFKEYILGDVIVNNLLAGGVGFNDRFERRVYSTTVQLRNPLYMALYSTQLRAIMK